MGIFQNSWFIGIATGIISGVLVFFITKFFMNKKDKTEYYQNVKNANDRVIAALKPYIADKGLPVPEVFDSLIKSTARTYQVQQEDMFSIENYCEELIREIISDVYVSNDKKEQYTNSLADYKSESLKTKIDVKSEKAISDIKLSEMKSKYNSRLSLYLSMFVALFGSFATSIILMSDMFDSFSISSNYLFLIPILILAFVMVVLVMFRFTEVVFRRVKERNADDENNNINDLSDKSN